MLFALSLLEEVEAQLPEIVGKELVDKKRSGQSFLVVFGTHECPACKAVQAGLSEEIKKGTYGVEVVFVDCQNEKNRPACVQYEIHSFPTMVMFNHVGLQGKKPAKYDEHDYSYDKIMGWAESHSQLPFVKFTQVDNFIAESKKHDSFVVILTPNNDLDGYGYKFARDFKAAHVLVLAGVNPRIAEELEGSAFENIVDEDETVLAKCD